MRSLRWVGAAVLSLSVATPAAAQVGMKLTKAWSPNYTTGGVVWNGVYVGPYQGQMVSQPGRPLIDIFCVDYLNSVSINQTWQSRFSVLSGSLTNTRFGSLAGAQILYQKAAWLSSRFKFRPTTEWGGIHSAIWRLFTPTAPPLSTSAAAIAQYWLDQASVNYQTINLSEWSVVTDVNTVNGSGGVQEYLTHNVVPEPATILLMGTGLLAVVGAGLVSRRLI